MSRNPKKSKDRGGRKLRCEALEKREMLSVNAGLAPALVAA